MQNRKPPAQGTRAYRFDCFERTRDDAQLRLAAGLPQILKLRPGLSVRCTIADMGNRIRIRVTLTGTLSEMIAAKLIL